MVVWPTRMSVSHVCVVPPVPEEEFKSFRTRVTVSCESPHGC